jgi:hypothetical protein
VSRLRRQAGARGSPGTRERPVGSQTRSGRSRSPASSHSPHTDPPTSSKGSTLTVAAQGRARHCAPARPAVITTTADNITATATSGRVW